MADNTLNEIRAQNMANALLASMGISPAQIDNSAYWALVQEAGRSLADGVDSTVVGQAMATGLRGMVGIPEPAPAASQSEMAPAAGGAGKTPGATGYAQLSEYLASKAGLVQVGVDGSPYILGKDANTGKVITAYELDPETGLYVPIDVDGVGGSAGTSGGTGSGGYSGGGGGGGSAGPSYIDIQNADLAKQTLERNIFESDREYAERVRQYNQNFGENQRQFGATEQRLNMSDVGQLGVQLGNLNLEQQKYIAQILREPADFMARAFTQRGGTSPFPEITQADLINKLRTEFDRIRQFTGNEMQQRVGGAGGGGAGLPLPSNTALPGAQPRMNMSQPDTAGIGALGTVYNLQPGYQGLTQDQEVAFHQEGLQAAGQQLAAGGDTNVEDWEKVAQDFQNRGYDIPGFEEGTVEGPVRSRISIVGEEGPETLLNHGDGSFDILNNEQTMEMLGQMPDAGPPSIDLSRLEKFEIDEYKSGTKQGRKLRFTLGTGGSFDDDVVDVLGVEDRRPPKTKAKPVRAPRAGNRTREQILKEKTAGVNPYKIKGYAGGTFDDLSPDVMGRMSLFDTAAVPETSQQQLLQYAQTATPPGPASVAAGQLPPNLDVAKGSSFKLFSPQQYMSLTPDEQAALATRLAVENRSLGDFLFSSQKNFAGRPRQQRRARFDVTS